MNQPAVKSWLDDAWQGRAAALLRVFAVCGSALLLATWRLWTPQSAYPQVPLLAWADAAPAWLEWIALAAIPSALATVLLAPLSAAARAALWVFAAAIAALACIDQHRLQPWAYQFALTAILLASCRPRRGLALLRLVVVSIYFYSAVSKFDYQFLHTLGQQFLTVVASAAGLDCTQWPAPWRLAAAAMFPVGELLLAAGLLLPATRRAAVVGAVLLHALLLWILGPWGLRQQPAVLVWNVYFMAQAALLFWPAFRQDHSAAADAPAVPPIRAGERAAAWLTALVIVLPLTELWGGLDHWLAWALYSPRNSRALIYLRPQAAEGLPAAIRQHLDDVPGQAWQRLHIDRWSLAALGAPIYPQDRFQLGVAIALLRRHQLEGDMQVVLQGAASRYSGVRSEETIRSRHGLQRAAQRFWFNAQPRDN